MLVRSTITDGRRAILFRALIACGVALLIGGLVALALPPDGAIGPQQELAGFRQTQWRILFAGFSAMVGVFALIHPWRRAIAAKADDGVAATRAPKSDPESDHESIRAANAALRTTLLAALPGGAAVFDANEQLVAYNAAFSELHGVDQVALHVGMTLEALLARGLSNGRLLSYTDDEDRASKIIADMRDHNASKAFQLPDGCIIEMCRRAMHDGTSLLLCVDVTERKESGLRLQQQSLLLETTFEHMGEGLTVIDADGGLVAWNNKFAQSLDLKLGVDHSNMSLPDLLMIFGHVEYPTGRETHDDLSGRLLAMLMEPAGLIHWCSADGRVFELRSGGLPGKGAVTLYNDITERRAQEQKLYESEAQKSAIIAASLDPVISTDVFGRITEFNPAAVQTFGWRAEEVIGRRIADIMIAAESRAAYSTAIQVFRTTGRSPLLDRRIEIVAVRRDGTVFPAELVTAAIEVENRTALTAYVRDISDRKRTEKEIRLAQEAAEAANTAKSEFLAMISHELRTPMNGIIGLTDMLLETDLVGTQLQFAHGIDDSAKRLLALVNDILEFSRIEAGRLTLDIAPFDLPDLLSSAVETTRVLVGKKPVSVRLSADNDLPRHMQGDSTRLYQILHNLLANAAKFTEAGEILLRATAEQISGDRVGLRFEVVDTGPGIPEDARARLFNPFEQGRSDTYRNYGGSGLGLSISRQLAELMGGNIGFISQVGHGSTFWFDVELQVVGETAETDTTTNLDAAATLEASAKLETRVNLDIGAAATAASGRAPTAKLKILVAEDTPTSQLVIRTMLERDGHRVRVVDDGAEAVAAVVAGRYDVVLMDMQMPVLDGLDAARRIRALPGAQGRVPIISLTAQARASDRERATAAGIEGYLVKPLRLKHVRDALAHIPASALPGGVGNDAPELGAPHDMGTMPAVAMPAVVTTPDMDLAAMKDLLDAVGVEEFHHLLRQFDLDCVAALKELSRVTAVGDFDGARRIAHRLNGLLSQFGLTTVAALAARLEHAGDGDAWTGMSQKLIDTAPSASAALQRDLGIVNVAVA